MKYAELVLLIGALNGCASDEPTAERETVAADYRCAAKQMKRVKHDCLDASPSWQEYCELEARKKFCERIGR